MTVDSVDLGLSHITVLQTIGRGGFSVVYKAHDTKLNRHVAVKVLTAVVDQRDLDRFEQECQIHGPLSTHPNIVTIHDAGYTPSGSPFLVMEYLDSGSLSDQLIADGPTTWQKAVELMAPVCDAVSTAHRAGILHRDIKPANILLADDGPKLADFGIACVSDATSPQFAVSWLHAPPEAEKNQRDERSDVYSLASTMYQLIAGHAPFERSGQDNLASLLRRIVEDAAPQLASTTAPAWLNTLLQQALAKNPAERPSTAAEFGAALINGPATESAATRPLALVAPYAQATTRQPGVSPAALYHQTDPSHTNRRPTTHALPLEAGAQLPHSNEHSYEPAPSHAAAYRAPKPRRSKTLPVAAAVLALATVGFFLSPAWAALSPDDNRGSASSNVSSDETPKQETSTTIDGSTTSSSESTTTTKPEDSATEPESPTTSEDSGSTEQPRPSDPPNGGTVDTQPPPPPPPVEAEVPNVVGRSQAQAVEDLEAEGFTNISVVTEPSSTVDEGLVIRTNPGLGSVSELDSPIVVTVSSGPELVVVPDLFKLDADSAVAIANAAGLETAISFDTVPADDPSAGIVTGQDRAPGTKAPAGSVITLLVARAESRPIVTIPPVIAPPGEIQPTTTIGILAPNPTL